MKQLLFFPNFHHQKQLAVMNACTFPSAPAESAILSGRHPDCRSTRLGGSPESIALSARTCARICPGIHNCQLFLNPNSQINFTYCTQLRRSPPVHVRICDHCVLYISLQKIASIFMCTM